MNRLLIAELIRLGDPGTIYAPRAAIWTSERTYLEPDLFYLSKETEARLGPERRPIWSLKLFRRVPPSLIDTPRPIPTPHWE